MVREGQDILESFLKLVDHFGRKVKMRKKRKKHVLSRAEIIDKTTNFNSLDVNFGFKRQRRIFQDYMLGRLIRRRLFSLFG